MDYKGLRDRHLNVFCGYGVEHLENNITKALINTLDSLNAGEQSKIYSAWVDFPISREGLKTSFYLQRRPSEAEIRLVPLENRYVVGMSPTGECWGCSLRDVHDDAEMKVAIAKEWSQGHPDVSDDELEIVVSKTIDDIHKRRDGGSIPDAWIFIHNYESSFLIIIENKLYNLDPDQINNHIEKSLYITNTDEKKRARKYITFEKVAGLIEQCNTYLSDQFIEYMTILGYLKLESFPLACSADKEIRQSLAVECGKRIMQDIFKNDIDRRNYTAIRKHLDKNSFLREINLCFDRCQKENGSVYLSLAVGATMSSARWMYGNVDLPFKFDDRHIQKPFASFHLQYNRGKNIRKSYLSGIDWEISDYINYWKGHVSELKLLTPQEASKFIMSLYEAGKVPFEMATDISTYLYSKKNTINIVPEIIYEIEWSCEEVSNMKDNAEFEQSIKVALTELLNALGYKLKL